MCCAFSLCALSRFRPLWEAGDSPGIFRSEGLGDTPERAATRGSRELPPVRPTPLAGRGQTNRPEGVTRDHAAPDPSDPGCSGDWATTSTAL